MSQNIITENSKKLEDEKIFESRHNLTDEEFYEQACSYFYYHAEQRTTMINYFIAVFAACIALYGSLLSKYAWASVLVATFLTIISVLFYFIDLRNKFDVKGSQSVIEQIERDYGMDRVFKKHPYGVFSNEANTYRFYGYTQRHNDKYMKLRSIYKKYRKNKISENEFENALNNFIGEDDTISRHELICSFDKSSIISLSFCIKMLYVMCTSISFMSILLAIAIAIK